MPDFVRGIVLWGKEIAAGAFRLKAASYYEAAIRDIGMPEHSFSYAWAEKNWAIGSLLKAISDAILNEPEVKNA